MSHMSILGSLRPVSWWKCFHARNISTAHNTFLSVLSSNLFLPIWVRVSESTGVLNLSCGTVGKSPDSSSWVEEVTSSSGLKPRPESSPAGTAWVDVAKNSLQPNLQSLSWLPIRKKVCRNWSQTVPVRKQTCRQNRCLTSWRCRLLHPCLSPHCCRHPQEWHWGQQARMSPHPEAPEDWNSPCQTHHRTHKTTHNRTGQNRRTNWSKITTGTRLIDKGQWVLWPTETVFHAWHSCPQQPPLNCEATSVNTTRWVQLLGQKNTRGYRHSPLFWPSNSTHLMC